MAVHSAFELVGGRGWLRGFGNLLGYELARWWKTRMWWIQCLIWTSIIGFMLGSVFFSAPDFSLQDAVMLYSIFAGMFPAVGVVILMQGAVVGEKKDGTAAWVLSKPVMRPAFVFSKLIADKASGEQRAGAPGGE